MAPSEIENEPTSTVTAPDPVLLSPDQESVAVSESPAPEEATPEEKWNEASIGSTVIVGPGYPATIIGFRASENHVCYRCVWWDGPKRFVRWLESCELDMQDIEEKLPMGFARPASVTQEQT